MTAASSKSGRPAMAARFTVKRPLVVTVILVILISLVALGSAVRKAREIARRCQCTCNLKCTALALHNYHDTYDSFPPAYIADEDGKPMHSWRVLILPFMEQRALYEQYNFDEPWDGQNNSKLHDTVINAHRCPSHPRDDFPATTNYVAVVGPDTVFSADQSTKIGDITDGTANTLLVVELVNSDIHWMEPRDLTIEDMPAIINPGEGRSHGISSMHPGGANVVWCDGLVQFLPDNLSTKKLRAMLTIAGGEEIDRDDY